MQENKTISNYSRKIAFLASRPISSESVLKCYDWATEQRRSDNYIISGFHSELGKDVLYFLLKAQIPTILILGRSPYKILSKEFGQAVNEGLLQIISVSNAERQAKADGKSIKIL